MRHGTLSITVFCSATAKSLLGLAPSIRFGVSKKLSRGHGLRIRATSGGDGNKVEIPRQWYNLVADLPVKPPPALHPKTHKPLKQEDLSPLFPDELIKQEVSDERFIPIPEEVIDIYRLWRPTPLIRFVHLFFLWPIKQLLRIYLPFSSLLF